uniref:Restriction endonuclease n=1 Tax=Strongyloides venezuelensis TaxID=75913 RepID=A0A0K0FSX3_STRVS
MSFKISRSIRCNKSGDMKIAAGVKYTFGTAKIYYNKPDLIWYTPDAIYVIEVINSTDKLKNFAALDNLKKVENFVEILSQKENFKKVQLMPLVFCTYGEIPKETMKYLKELNFTKEKIKTIALSIARLTGRTLKAHFTN